MRIQSKKCCVMLIVCMIFLCAMSGCGMPKTEPPEIEMESGLTEVESNAMDMATSEIEQKKPADELVPKALLDTLNGWYVSATGMGAHKYNPIRNLLFYDPQNDLTFGDLWKWDNYQYEEVWGTELYVAYDENQTSPIVFPALFKELKKLESLGITAMAKDEIDINTNKDVHSESGPHQQVEFDWSNLESMTWLLNFTIISNDMGTEKEDLYECVKNFKNLKVLTLEDPAMINLPDVFAPLTQLENLVLLETKIQNYPLSFYQLDNLKTLQVSDGNNSPFDAAQLNGWPLLSRLKLDCTLPEGNYNFSNLEELWFAPDSEGNLPDVVSTFENLKSLSIYGDLKAIPESYKNLINLEKIYLYSYSEQKPYTDLKNSLIESIQKERARRGLPPSELERPIRPE